jgi:hypothetical protein
MKSRRLRQSFLFGLGLLSTLSVFGSFLVQLYGKAPELAAAPTGPQNDWAHAWCLGSLARLQRELNEQLAGCATAAHGPAALARYRRWESPWRQRFVVAVERCEALPQPSARAAAEALRHLDQHAQIAMQELGAQSQADRQLLRQQLADG